MAISFKRYLVETTEKREQRKSIPHLEDLSIDEFIEAIESLHDLVATEKLDGTALTFGFDGAGEFYTSRQGKGSSKPVYNSEDWGESAASNVFKAAHEALKDNEETLASIVEPGEAYDIEILYGEQPNAVTYGAGGFSYIAFLNAASGTNELADLDHDKVKALGEALKDVTSNVSIEAVDTTDGINLITSPTTTTWKFVTPHFIPADELKDLNLEAELRAMMNYLSDLNYTVTNHGEKITNREVYDMNLTSGIRKGFKDKIKTEREKVREVIKNDFMLSIKELMLDGFVRNFQSEFQADTLENNDDGFVEGLVFMNPTTNEMFKVVDTEVFKEINTFNYKVRRMVRGKIMTDNPDAEIQSRGGLYGEALIRIVNLFNIDGLARPNSIKKTLKTFKDDDVESTVNNIVSSLNNVNFQAVKRKSIAIIDNLFENLDEALDTFKVDHKDYELELSNGKIIKYSPEIVHRTLLTFAEARRDAESLRSRIASSEDLTDMIVVLFGRHIKNIHGLEE